MSLVNGFNSIKTEQVNYLRQYTFNEPLLISVERNNEFRKLGKILHKAIIHMIDNYDKYLKIMPRDKRELEILEICRRFSYKAGTFRTDYLIDENGSVKIIEMTTRQPFNAYFMAGSFREIAFEQKELYGIGQVVDDYPEIWEYLEDYMDKPKQIVVIKGDDRFIELRFYPELFEKSGYTCKIINLPDLIKNKNELENSFVIEELNLKEIKSLSDYEIEILASSKLHNDICALLTTHDKRFFHALSCDNFLNNFLGYEEVELLKKYTIPTYISGNDESIWTDSYYNKNDFILKPADLGKSEGIYAGILTDEIVWKRIFDSGEIENMILQPYIHQRKFNGSIGKEKRCDYAAGTLLYFNDKYFGPTVFRTSSNPISNLSDFRKMVCLVTNDYNQDSGLNFI